MSRQIGLVTRTDLKQAMSGPRKAGTSISPDRLKEFGCKACPLNRVRVASPKMKPSGPGGGLYILTEMPTEADDRDGTWGSGEAGRLLRRSLGRHADSARWNAVLRCRKNGKDIADTEVECCRGFLEADILAQKPRVVFALGSRVVGWFGAQGGAHIWRGRIFPAQIGDHRFWVVPLKTPDDIIRERDGRAGREWSEVWERDIRRGLIWLRNHPEPKPRRGISDFIFKEGEFTRFAQLTGGPGDLEALRGSIQRLHHGLFKGMISIDVETYPQRPYSKDSRILSIALGWGGGGISVALDHPGAKWGDKLGAAKELISTLFRAPSKRFIMHNAVFDLEYLAVIFALSSDDILRHEWNDTMAQAFILDERQGALSLGFLTFQHFGVDVKKLTPAQDKNDLRKTPLKQLLEYNLLDAVATYDLFQAQEAELKRESMSGVYEFHRTRIATLTIAQKAGMRVDVPRVRELLAEYTSRIDRAVSSLQGLKEWHEFRRLKGEDFDDKKNQHVEFMLRSVMRRNDGLDPETGKYSTDESVLVKIKHSLIRLVLELRGLRKLRSTYLEPYIPGSPDALIHDDGKIHTNYKPQRAGTGRLASEDPNLQNFPKRDKEAKEVRSIVVPPRRWRLLAVDYGQIEARVIAAMSKDRNFVRALWDRYDVHQYWAEKLAKAYPEILRIHSKESDPGKRMKDLRDKTKNGMVFPALFKSSERSIGRSMELPDDIMSRIFREFWVDFRGIRSWQDRLISEYRERGYVETMTKRRRHYSVENGPLTPNAIVNTPVQGTAADIMVNAMDRLAVKSVELDMPFLAARMTIHDDLSFCIPRSRVDEAIEIITDEMVRLPWAWSRVVPWTAEVSIGRDWSNMEAILKVSSDELSRGPQRPDWAK